MKDVCQCCGSFTLDEGGGNYDICPVCFWEDDAVQNADPAYAGGANEPSLIEAKANFAAFGAVERRVLPFVRDPLPEERPESATTPSTAEVDALRGLSRAGACKLRVRRIIDRWIRRPPRR